MADKTTDSACPVDHKTRDAWMQQARTAESSSSQPTACPVDHTSSSTSSSSSSPQSSQSRSWTQSLTSYLPWSSSSPSASPSTSTTDPSASRRAGLDTDRVISTIPRSSGSLPNGTAPVDGSNGGSSSSSTACPVPHGSSANAEIETGSHHSGNWVYPSEKMFFEAMKRKGYEARETDMKTVVPIHNAVNERAWKEIREWEAPYLKGTQCDGPKLESFANKMERMTPTARINTMIGYTAPFDRHDWVIDRCGTRVDYVIDFYSGRGKGGASSAGPGPSFYLDVRPKLNTWEGVKMRAWRWTGLA